MCKYCDFDDTLECNEIKQERFNAGVYGNKSTGIYLVHYYKDNSYTLEILEYLIDENSNAFGETVTKVNIKYCPFCGRELK